MTHCWIERRVSGRQGSSCVVHHVWVCVCVLRVSWWGKSSPSVLAVSRGDGSAKSGEKSNVRPVGVPSNTHKNRHFKD